jgi:hypothetical protein
MKRNVFSCSSPGWDIQDQGTSIWQGSLLHLSITWQKVEGQKCKRGPSSSSYNGIIPESLKGPISYYSYSNQLNFSMSFGGYKHPDYSTHGTWQYWSLFCWDAHMVALINTSFYPHHGEPHLRFVMTTESCQSLVLNGRNTLPFSCWHHGVS